MTSTLLPQQHSAPPSSPKSSATATANMTWSNEKLRFSCIDNISLKQLWKLIVLDSTPNTPTAGNQQSSQLKHEKCQQNHKIQEKQHRFNTNNTHEKLNHENYENFADYVTNREFLTPSSMSLLKFFAINALELSAPATPVLLQQNSQQNPTKNAQPQGWMQLSGHPESIVPTSTGIVRKRINSLNDNEVQAYTCLSQETQTAQIAPQFYGTTQIGNEYFLQLQDLLTGFKDPCVMDIKLGCRTFLESEVSNKTLRPDLYKKMISVDPNAPTAEEHSAQAITKLRYMLFREEMSSSHSKGFRIEAIRLRGRPPIKDLKTVRTNDQIQQTIQQFLLSRKSVQKDLVKRLKEMRHIMELSPFFKTHEIVGSSIFIVYDDQKFGVWLIDFAKSRQLPANMTVNHRTPWLPGNSEEGLLKGMDELIKAFETTHEHQQQTRKCLQI